MARFWGVKHSPRNTHTPRDACPVSMPTRVRALDEELPCMGPRKETHVSLGDNRSSHRLAFCLSGWVQDWAVVFFCFVLFASGYCLKTDYTVLSGKLTTRQTRRQTLSVRDIFPKPLLRQAAGSGQ